MPALIIAAINQSYTWQTSQMLEIAEIQWQIYRFIKKEGLTHVPKFSSRNILEKSVIFIYFIAR